MSVRGSARSALLLAGTGTRAVVSELDVSTGGRGVMVQCATGPGEACPAGEPPDLALRRVRIVGAQTLGIGVDEAHAVIEDARIDGVSASGQLDGFGVVAVGARVEGARIDVTGATRHAVLAYGAGASMDLRALQVLDTQPSPECEGEGCARERAGNAITCAERATISLHDFVAERAAYAGLLMVQGCTTDVVERGRIMHNALGVLTDGTVEQTPFVGIAVDQNGTDYQTTMLRVERPTFGSETSSTDAL